MKNPVSTIAGMIFIISILFPLLSYTMGIKIPLFLKDWENIFVGIGAIMLILSEETKFRIKAKIIGLFLIIISILGFFLDNFVYSPIGIDLLDCIIETGMILFIIGIVAEICDLIIVIELMIFEYENNQKTKEKVPIVKNIIQQKEIKEETETNNLNEQVKSLKGVWLDTHQDSTLQPDDPKEKQLKPELDNNKKNEIESELSKKDKEICTSIVFILIAIAVIAYILLRAYS